MIKIEKTEVVGWEHVIRGMRNPMNSWDQSDSKYVCSDKRCTSMDGCDLCCEIPHFIVGEKDADLMMRLRNAGTDHRKFMRMIIVYMDITAPLYWWKEFDTYKIGTVANSCSTMHKIHDKEFTLEDFSCEHLLADFDLDLGDGVKIRSGRYPWGSEVSIRNLEATIYTLNIYRKKYLETKDKEYWWQMIQLLPSAYNQKRTVMLNYEVLINMYHNRKNHKLDEWHNFCEWIETLPYKELICSEK